MGGIKTAFVISFISIFLFSCASNKDIFTDPQAKPLKEGVYKVNKEPVHLPTYFELPSSNQQIKLNFEKPAAKPLEVSLQFTVDGWKAPNGKILSDGKSNFGIVLDFPGGGVYEMPKNELEKVLSTFRGDNATVVAAVHPKQNGGSTVKLAVIDAGGNFNKQELKYLNLINNSAQTANKNGASQIQEEMPAFVNSDIRTLNPVDPKNSVIAGKPVISAAANDQYDRLAKLISSGGNINETEEKTGNNALIEALRYGNEDVSNFLIDKGINTNHSNIAGKNALHAAAEVGYYDLSKKLIDKGVNVNTKDRAGNTPLLYAAASPNSNLVDLLTENGARIEDKNIKGETPLSVAALVGNTKTVENLIKKGADTKTKDADGNNTIMKAVAGGNQQTVKTLINAGVPIDEKNNFGVGPLHTAVKAGYQDIAQELLSKGADVNAKDPQGDTPLIIATDNGNPNIVSDILKYKPDMITVNKDGQNAYDVAAEKGYNGILRTLRDSAKNMDSVTELLFNRTAANDMVGVEDAIKNGARINSVDIETGNTVLFTAVANNYLNLAGYLISHGADVNHLNSKGNTPLIVAVSSADIGMVDLLIKSGAIINARNNTGDTALIWAVKLKRPDIVKSLLLGGADPNIKNSDGISAYAIADTEGTKELVNLLQAAGGHK